MYEKKSKDFEACKKDPESVYVYTYFDNRISHKRISLGMFTQNIQWTESNTDWITEREINVLETTIS